MPLVMLFCMSFAACPALYAFNWCDQKMDGTVEPRVLQAGQTGIVKYTLWSVPDPTKMEVELFAGGMRIPVVHQPNGAWTFQVTAEQALAGYQAGLGRNYFGKLYQWEGATLIAGYTNLVVNVRDEIMPLVPIRTLAAGQAQMTRHVLNMRDDTAYYWGTSPVGPPASFFQRFYTYRQDDFDFLAVVAENLAFENRYYVGVRNTTQGLGSAVANSGAAYGSPSRLQGYVNFPNDNFFDLAETGLSHELGHRWCCFLDMPTLGKAHEPHWPMGDIAYGMMGTTDPGNKQGLQFPYTLVPQADGAYQVNATPLTNEFNDLELYLMGLLPANQVPEHFIFNNQNQTATPGGTLQGPVTRFTINDIIARNGQRVPAFGAAPTQFRLGTIALSRGRLLEPYEMAFFEYMAARGEATAELDAYSGAWLTRVKPFYLSTRTKGTLSTTVCPDCVGAASTVSAASFVRGGDLAPESIASVFGFGLTDTIQIATTQPLPPTLDSTSVRVTDSAGTRRDGSLFFISQMQINYTIPKGSAAGAATVDVIHRGQTVASGQVNLAPVAPALFTANSNGSGVPAANVIRVVHSAQGAPVVSYESPAQCGTAYGSCTPKPIDLGAANVEVFLELYGTGIRGRSSLSAVTCTIGGTAARVDYAGEVAGLTGLDQVNVLIPRSLIGRGQVNLILNVDGKLANTVNVSIR